MRVIFITVLALFMSACANQEISSVNVIIMVEDNSVDALPRNHQAVQRLVSKVSSQLSDNGINVYDETALTLDNFDFNGRLTSAELIDIARSVHHVTLDYIVLLSIDASVNSNSYGQKINTKVFGKTIQLHSGKVTGSFNARGRKLNANNNCSRGCLNSKVSDSISATAADVAAEILADLPRVTSKHRSYKSDDRGISQDYVLIFDGFNQSDMDAIARYLTIFSGYDGMRYSESSHRYTEIWYESSISEAKLNRNLKRMLKEMPLKASVYQETNVVTLKKITLRGQEKPKFDLDGWD